MGCRSTSTATFRFQLFPPFLGTHSFRLFLVSFFLSFRCTCHCYLPFMLKRRYFLIIGNTRTLGVNKTTKPAIFHDPDRSSLYLL